MSLEDFTLPAREDALLLAWPSDGLAGEFLRFDEPEQWRLFISSLGIHSAIPEVVAMKFARAQMLYLMGWIDIGLIKAGELAALIALELALMDRYGGQISKRKRNFAALLAHMVDADGLTDQQIPLVIRCGGTAIGQLTGAVHPTLAERRNGLAHGDPFEGLPTGGLLELVRDLINFAYRHYIAEAEAAGFVQ